MPRFLSILFCALLSAASTFALPPQTAFRISFRDKSGAPQLSQTPSWLSMRAMARRVNFGIALDSTDRPVSPLYVDTVLALSGGKLHNTSRWLNQCVVLLPDTTSLLLLRAKSWVKSIEWVGYFPNGLHNRPAGQPNPKSELNAIGLHQYKTTKVAGSSSYYGATWGQTYMVHGDTLHDQGFRGKGKLVAMLDDGFSGVDVHRGFDSMRREGRLLDTYNFLTDSSFVFAYGEHGTACFSDIAGLLPTQFVGSAPDAQYALYVTEDGSVTDALYELDNLVAGMERADSLGADIISASLGYNTFVSPYNFIFPKSDLDGKTTIVAKAVNAATAKGILYVSSAGNEGGNFWNFLTTPADADSALTVGAVYPNRSAAEFSSPGPNAAGIIKPDVALQGVSAAIFTSGGGLNYSSGTSFSTPQAAGWAACLMQAFPTLSPYCIRDAFAHISDAYLKPTAQLGYGIPDFRLAQQYLARYIPDTSSGPLFIGPNPFSNSISVALRQTKTVSAIAMYDVVGRTVSLRWERTGSTMSITPAGNLPAGLYILSLTADGKQYVQKMTHL